MPRSENLIYFAHGQESGPWGHKITALASVGEKLGWTCESPDQRFTHDPQLRAEHFLESISSNHRSLVLVGSSMGGFVCADASAHVNPAGLFLMAPAIDLPGFKLNQRMKSDCICIIHGWRDDIVPVTNSMKLAKKHRANLHVLDADHGLAEQLPMIENIFAFFLRAVSDRMKEPLIKS